jgi:hypothetical protein
MNALRIGVVVGAAIVGSGCGGRPASLDGGFLSGADAFGDDSAVDGASGDDSGMDAASSLDSGGCPGSCKTCVLGMVSCKTGVCQCCVGTLCGPN